MLKGVLKRYSPKIIILDIVNKEFQKNADSYEKISPLLPYYNSHPEIRSIVQLRSRYEKHKLFLYKEDVKKFSEALEETLSHLKNELMPDYDFDAVYDKDLIEDKAF